MTASRDVGEPTRTRSRGMRVSSAPPGVLGDWRERDCPDAGRCWGRLRRVEVVALLGVMNPGSPGRPGKGVRVARVWITYGEIHRGGECRLKERELAGSLPAL
jgi:hypothetical protein